MTIRIPMGGVAVLALLACSTPAKRESAPKPGGGSSDKDACFYDCPKGTPTAQPKDPKDPPKPTPQAPAPKAGPVTEKAAGLREAAEQLEKAQRALDNGNRNLADQLFSTAEILTGPEALASLAPLFREGAPPRVTAPTQKVDTTAPP